MQNMYYIRLDVHKRTISYRVKVGLVSIGRKKTNGVPLVGRRSSELWTFYSNFCFSVQAGAGTLAYLASAADIPAADHGLARGSAHSNGWHVRCARAARCHSPARAAVAVPGYR